MRVPGASWWRALRSLFRAHRRTVTRTSSSDVIHVDTAGRVVGHTRTLKLERRTFL